MDRKREINVTVKGLTHHFIMDKFKILSMYNFNPRVQHTNYLVIRLNKYILKNNNILWNDEMLARIIVKYMEDYYER